MEKRFFEVLFEPGEETCFGKDTFETRLKSHYLQCMSDSFFSINPMHTKRCDANVTVFRNILVEFDKGSVGEQWETIHASEIPHTSILFSGGKSLHLIISLKEPCTNEEEYRALVKRIYFKMGGEAVIDTKCGNPSRFSRSAYSTRDFVTVQELIKLQGRVSKEALFAWLGPAPVIKKAERETPRFKGDFNKHTKFFLLFGAEEGNWNSSLFKAACDMTRAQLTRDEIEERCEEITGRLDNTDRATISSAVKASRRDT